MSEMSGRTERLMPARSVWARSMVWWHVGFYAAMLSVSSFAVFGQQGGSGSPLVIGLFLLLGVAYPFLTRTKDLRTGRPTIYVALLVLVVVFLSFVYAGAGALLFVAFPQVWMFTANQRQGVLATAVLCVGVAAGQVSRLGVAGTEIYGITAQLVTSFVASCMIGLWISKVIEQSEQRAELLAELEATRQELNAVEHARGALAERERMAREIHDTLAQGFTSIAMLSEAAQAQLKNRHQAPAGLARSLTAIAQTARESLAEARALVTSGVPSDVRGGDLLAALQRLPDSLHLDSVRLTVALPEALPPLPSTQQVALLRTAQEALNNIRKHSAATAAELLMDFPAGDPPSLRLTVTDNGRGFDARAEHQGFGLTSMAARLAEIGGRLHVTSEPGATRLVAVIPAAAPAAGLGGDGRPLRPAGAATTPGAVG